MNTGAPEKSECHHFRFHLPHPDGKMLVPTLEGYFSMHGIESGGPMPEIGAAAQGAL
jgi:hypothetical protein